MPTFHVSSKQLAEVPMQILRNVKNTQVVNNTRPDVTWTRNNVDGGRNLVIRVRNEETWRGPEGFRKATETPFKGVAVLSPDQCKSSSCGLACRLDGDEHAKLHT